MTPRELDIYVKGFNKKKDRELEQLSWHAAAIINHRTPAVGEKRRKAVTPAELLGRKKESIGSKDEMLAVLRKRKKRLEDEATW